MNIANHDSPKEKHEEILETIGVALENGSTLIADLQNQDITIPKLEKLISSNHIYVDDDKYVHFLPKGEREFLSLIRRHRLTERLLNDVLDFSEEEGAEAIICKMEHIVTEDFADSICTLLGHPTVSPSGRPIPPGRCCIQGKDRLRPLILALNRMESGEEGTIAFISSTDSVVLDRLAAMGLIPGVKLTLKQKKPAAVILFEQTVLSMDDEYAKAIYIRRNIKKTL